MKLTAGQVAGFLRDPGPCRVVLLYGEDVGMIRDHAESLVRTVAGSLDDPFRVVELARDELGRIADEAASLSLTGGRRVVRVREAGDAALSQVQQVLAGRAPGLVVLEAAGLPSRSRLRTLVESAPDAVAIGCYPEEGRALEATIRGTLQAFGAMIDADTVTWLGSQLGADRVSTRSELEKLALYVGEGHRIDIDAAMACVGDLAGLSLDDALYAATTGDVATTDRALEVAMIEGAAAVQILRAGLAHLLRLHRARLTMELGGLSAADATKAVRPPLFYRRVSGFARSLMLWPSPALVSAMAGLSEAERGCKRTGWPDLTLCRSAVLTIARRAAAVAGQSRR
ncbi:MAG: DNA polymerase III subunit delta [Acetobacteraceae bacterium]